MYMQGAKDAAMHNLGPSDPFQRRPEVCPCGSPAHDAMMSVDVFLCDLALVGPLLFGPLGSNVALFWDVAETKVLRVTRQSMHPRHGPGKGLQYRPSMDAMEFCKAWCTAQRSSLALSD